MASRIMRTALNRKAAMSMADKATSSWYQRPPVDPPETGIKTL